MTPSQSARTVEKQRDIQEEVAKADRKGGGDKPGAMQAGARLYPVPPFPQQHQPKPQQQSDTLLRAIATMQLDSNLGNSGDRVRFGSVIN